jgi:hypothetical protein
LGGLCGRSGRRLLRRREGFNDYVGGRDGFNPRL